MAADDPLLLNIAGAILDGADPDWPSLESSASESQRAVFAELQAVAAIGSLRRRQPSLPVSTPLRPLDGVTTWGPLRVLEPIGHGGFGTVYRAWDPQLDREVALKLLPADEDAASTLAEGRRLARVRHPNVVTIFGADRVGDFVGFWMEFVHGQTLEQQLTANGRLAPAAVAAIGRQLCGALAAVHAAGLIHRDVKAHNVMVEPDGRLVLMDFGAGQALTADSGDVAGTPLYLAPEIFSGAPASVRSDVYSVGVLLHHLLTGTYPIAGKTLREVRDAHRRRTTPSSVSTLRPDVPAPLAAAIDRALAIDPTDRFEAADAMALALDPERRGSRMAALAAAAAAAVAVAAAWMGILPGLPGRMSASRANLGAVLTGAPTMHRLDVPGAELVGNGLSWDGRILSFTDREGGVGTFDLTTGAVQRLVEPAGGEFAEFSVTSPDGAQVAYEWWTTRGPAEIRVVERATKRVRLLLQDDTLDVLQPVEWKDAALLVWTKTRDGHGRIVLVDPASRGVETIRELPAGSAPLGLSVSPDGRYVAYDLPLNGAQGPRAVHIVDRAGQSDRVMPASPTANDRYPLWTADGGHLFFLSDRSGSPDGWLLPVEDGAASGEAALVVRNLGRVSSLGLTRGGTFYYRLAAGAFEVHEAGISEGPPPALQPPRNVAGRFAASNIGPSYAHDGRRLSYISVRDALGGTPVRTITIKNLVSGAERELNPAFQVGNAPARWSPDGTRLLVGSRVIDASSGALLHEFNAHLDREATSFGPIRWDASGTSVVFEREGAGLLRHPLAGGADVPVYRYGPSSPIERIHRFEVSPDGQRLALSGFRRDGSGTSLMLVSPGGEVELTRRGAPGGLVVQGWSPDGQRVFYTTFGAGAALPHELWRIAVTGGPPERLGTVNAATQINPVAVSPSGTAVAFTAGTPTNEVWAMERFLP